LYVFVQENVSKLRGGCDIPGNRTAGKGTATAPVAELWAKLKVSGKVVVMLDPAARQLVWKRWVNASWFPPDRRSHGVRGRVSQVIYVYVLMFG